MRSRDQRRHKLHLCPHHLHHVQRSRKQRSALTQQTNPFKFKYRDVRRSTPLAYFFEAGTGRTHTSLHFAPKLLFTYQSAYTLLVIAYIAHTPLNMCKAQVWHIHTSLRFCVCLYICRSKHVYTFNHIASRACL